MIVVGSASGETPCRLLAERTRRWVFQRTLRDLRLSVARGRPMSLPNLLRLYQRRADELAGVDTDVSILRDIYRLHQPFDITVPRAKRGRREFFRTDTLTIPKGSANLRSAGE